MRKTSLPAKDHVTHKMMRLYSLKVSQLVLGTVWNGVALDCFSMG